MQFEKHSETITTYKLKMSGNELNDLEFIISRVADGLPITSPAIPKKARKLHTPLRQAREAG